MRFLDKLAKEAKRAATDVSTFAQGAAQSVKDGDGIFYHIKDLKIQKIPGSLAQRSPHDVASAVVFGYDLSPLQFAASKAAIEVAAFINSQKPLNGAFEPHKKILISLMIFNFCVNTSMSKDALMAEVYKGIDHQRSHMDHTTLERVKVFFFEMLSNYTVSDNAYHILIPKFSINEYNQFSDNPNGVAKFTLTINGDTCVISNVDTISTDPQIAAPATVIFHPSDSGDVSEDEAQKWDEKPSATTTTQSATTTTTQSATTTTTQNPVASSLATESVTQQPQAIVDDNTQGVPPTGDHILNTVD